MTTFSHLWSDKKWKLYKKTCGKWTLYYLLLLSRCASVRDHVLFWLYVCPGQLLCLYDLLPCVRLPRPGGKTHYDIFESCSLDCMWKWAADISRWISVCLCVFVCTAVQGESWGTSNLATEPLRPCAGWRGGQQTQSCDPEGENHHGEKLCSVDQ